MKPVLPLALSCLLVVGAMPAQPLRAQALPSDPGAAQDAEADRKKVLKAADQIDLLQQNVDGQAQQLAALRAQLDQARGDLDAQKAQLAALKADNDSLRAALKQMDDARAEERKVLLDQVSKIVADGKRAPAPADVPAPKPSAPADGGAAAPDQKGYDYVVVKGDTLSAIAGAYSAQGVKVTVDDLRKANNLGKNDAIHVGQKLFVPKK